MLPLGNLACLVVSFLLLAWTIWDAWDRSITTINDVTVKRVSEIWRTVRSSPFDYADLSWDAVVLRLVNINVKQDIQELLWIHCWKIVLACNCFLLILIFSQWIVKENQEQQELAVVPYVPGLLQVDANEVDHDSVDGAAGEVAGDASSSGRPVRAAAIYRQASLSDASNARALHGDHAGGEVIQRSQRFPDGIAAASSSLHGTASYPPSLSLPLSPSLPQNSDLSDQLKTVHGNAKRLLDEEEWSEIDEGIRARLNKRSKTTPSSSSSSSSSSAAAAAEDIDNASASIGGVVPAEYYDLMDQEGGEKERRMATEDEAVATTEEYTVGQEREEGQDDWEEGVQEEVEEEKQSETSGKKRKDSSSSSSLSGSDRPQKKPCSSSSAAAAAAAGSEQPGSQTSADTAAAAAAARRQVFAAVAEDRQRQALRIAVGFKKAAMAAAAEARQLGQEVRQHVRGLAVGSSSSSSSRHYQVHDLTMEEVDEGDY